MEIARICSTKEFVTKPTVSGHMTQNKLCPLILGKVAKEKVKERKAKERAKEKAKEKAKEREREKAKEKGSQREKEKGLDLDSATTAASRTIKHSNVGTKLATGMGQRLSQKVKAELNQPLVMLPTSQREVNHHQVNWIARPASM